MEQIPLGVLMSFGAIIVVMVFIITDKIQRKSHLKRSH